MRAQDALDGPAGSLPAISGHRAPCNKRIGEFYRLALTYNLPVAGFLFPFLISAAITLLLVRSANLHRARTGDNDFSKPQKVHVVAVPRIGGLGIVLALCAWVGWLWSSGHVASTTTAALLACAGPAFVTGFVQDCSDAVTPRGRLLATAVSGGLAFFALDLGLRYTTIPGLDWVVGFTIGSLVVTVFSVTGIAHAINIIDGINGLASMCIMLMLGALAYVAFQVDDRMVTLIALGGIGAVLGFFLWNFPSGLIFMGDGGAYFLGFFFAELSILLLNRNPQVSPLFPLLVCIYPVFETLFSIYRRWLLRDRPAHLPDGIHLHSLIYRRVIRWALGESSAVSRTRRNSMTSPVLWLLCMASIIPATLWWDHTVVLAWCIVSFGAIYIVLYWRIVRFRVPRILRMLCPILRVPADILRRHD
jgi:UDP-N-acetylmuramyl pentapeptide phosphotransferase/UDP-N-acetylglucosamine-1-phosphate transferase